MRLKLVSPTIRPVGAAIAALAAVVLTTAFTVRPTVAPRAPASADTVTFAFGAGNNPNYIFPVMPSSDNSVVNLSNFQYLMYRPLYSFGANDQPILNTQTSIANLPVFSNGGRTVTITLKPYRWSDGAPVTARDVQFWENLVLAAKANFWGYIPGEYPTTVTNFRVLGLRTFSLTFNRAYGSFWLIHNQLSMITPLPQQAWDRTSVTGPVGNHDLTRSGALAVYRFLNSQATSLGTYASNPLWQVVDGPWHLESFVAATGYTVLAANPHYSGPVKPRLARVVEVPFTTDTAEFNALRAGSIDYGYLPTQDLSQRSYLESHGYQVVPWIGWGISFMPYNFANPVTGPLFRQLYIRQAMQMLINQPQYVRTIMKGYGYPDTGPVPLQPANPFASRLEQDNPYPYDQARALSLLATHGWAVHPSGTSTCSRPGSAASDCGTGIAAGAKLAFTIFYASGSVAGTQMMEAIQSSFSRAGIAVSLRSAPFTTVISVPTCTKGKPCTWDMTYWGGGGSSWIYGNDSYPTGGQLFATGAVGNGGLYSSPVNDANILATHVSSSIGVLQRYENYLAQQLPVLWVPEGDASISVISRHLSGALPQEPTLNVTPEAWSLAG